MKQFAFTALAAFVLVFASASVALSVHAQVVTTATGNAPILYNQSGTAVNPEGGNLTAGYYYLQNGDQVYYYGNGIYYDPYSTTKVYGGHLLDANGNLVYQDSTVTPGAPNTGAGDVASTWLVLAISGIAALTGMAYLASRSSFA